MNDSSLLTRPPKAETRNAAERIDFESTSHLRSFLPFNSLYIPPLLFLPPSRRLCWTMATSPSRPSKRSKPADEVSTSKKALAPQPRLFAPFRALGFISNHVPISVQSRGSKSATKGPSISIVSCLGDAWAMWEGEKMGLVFVGELRPKFLVFALLLLEGSLYMLIQALRRRSLSRRWC